MNLSGEIWIIIPTYNEAKNIAQLMSQIFVCHPFGLFGHCGRFLA
jgi:hypothetical protein